MENPKIRLKKGKNTEMEMKLYLERRKPCTTETAKRTVIGFVAN